MGHEGMPASISPLSFLSTSLSLQTKIALLSKLIFVKWGESGKCVTLAAEGELMMRPCDGTLKQVKSVEQEKIEVN